MMTRGTAPTFVAICATLSLGCASGYSPREPGRIHIVGSSTLEKDGRLYGMTGFSSDPIEAVSGNPAAEEHARTFVHRRQTMAILIPLELAVGISGAVLVAGGPNDRARNATAAGLALGSVVAAIVSVAVLAGARTHLYDAINIYNDDVARRSQGDWPVSTRDGAGCGGGLSVSCPPTRGSREPGP
jgi:hypothetical protein